MGFTKLWRKRWYLRAFFPSLVFNLRHLPFSQAWRVPIFLYKAKLRGNSGRFIIRGKIKTGMVRLGRNMINIYPNTGIVLQNHGTIIFNGRTVVGNDSAIAVGGGGVLEFGSRFLATCGLKLVCYHSVKLGDNMLVGWNTMIIDTDFHALKRQDTGAKSPGGYGPIVVGDDVWIANGCKLYKNTAVPAKCVVGADTILRKPVDCPSGSLITNRIDTSVRTTGYYHDCNDDSIAYPVSGAGGR